MAFLAAAALRKRRSPLAALERRSTAIDAVLPRSGRKIQVVPTGADPRLAQADPEPFAQRVGGRGFVLHLGQIETAKNQLGFLWAMRGTDTPMVILGDVAPGAEWYLAECRRAAGPQVQFVHGLRQDDPLLASAYAACGCVVLGNWFDPSASAALEAGMSGLPLILPEGGCRASISAIRPFM